MTQAGQRLTAACKEDHVEVDGFRIRYWESGPPRPTGVVVMLEGKQYIRRNFSCCVVYWFSYICLIGPDFDFSSLHHRRGRGPVRARACLTIRWRSTASLKLERVLELPERLGIALDVHQHVEIAL